MFNEKYKIVLHTPNSNAGGHWCSVVVIDGQWRSVLFSGGQWWLLMVTGGQGWSAVNAK